MSIAGYSDTGRSVGIIGFAEADRRAIERRLEEAGARLLHVADDGDASSLADLLVINASDLPSLDVAMARAAQARQLVVRASLQTVDAVFDFWPDADTVIGGDPVDLHLALTAALYRPLHPSLAAFDVASEEGLRLQRLADEIGRIARSLIDLPDGLMGNGSNVSDRPVNYRSAPADNIGLDVSAITAAEIRAIIRLRRLRDRYFSGELFADPAWDILLDLAAARIERTRVAVSSLCIAAAVPPTTALRWIKAMTDQGLLRRVADPHDARRIFIQLSDDSAAAMEQYLRACRGSAGMAI